jgi:hypothetical protein
MSSKLLGMSQAPSLGLAADEWKVIDDLLPQSTTFRFVAHECWLGWRWDARFRVLTICPFPMCRFTLCFRVLVPCTRPPSDPLGAWRNTVSDELARGRSHTPPTLRMIRSLPEPPTPKRAS